MKRWLVYIVVALVVAEVLLVLLSWLLSATMTDGVRSLLSSEGVRWFFGSFTAMMSSAWLVWLLLLSMAGGCLWQSGLLSMFQPRPGQEEHGREPVPTALPYRERLALRMTVVLLIIYIGVIVALTVTPHAVLLSATGLLFPSPFSRALVPIVAFGVLLISVVHGWVSGRFVSLADVVSSLTYGIREATPLFVLYVFLCQFVESLRFVLTLS